MKKHLLLTLALLAAAGAQADSEMLYGIYQGNGSLTDIGTEKAETYDVAIHLDEAYLVGMSIVGINVPVRTQATQATDYKAWLSTELTLSGGQNAPDIASVDFTPGGQWAQVTFETPYVITEAGVYAGFSFTIPSVDTSNDNDPNKKPLRVIASTATENVFIHTSRSYRKWSSFASTTYASQAPALVVRLGGDRVKANAATFIAPDELTAYASVGKQSTVGLTIVNHGTEAIKNIDYEVELDGETTTAHKAISLAGSYYGRQTSFNVTLPAVQTGGTRPVTFRLTQVNGQPNEDDVPEAVLSMAFLDQLPLHKPLMEEYTGGWCQWCPRGTAAMEAMTELYPDDFVGVAFHYGDAMQFTNYYPNTIQSYPSAVLDRSVICDPYNGTAGGRLGIQQDWKKRQSVIAPATLGLQAEFTDESQTAIRVTSTTTFVRDFAANPYRLTYILVSNGLKGSGSSWAQQNAFAGRSADYSSDPYLSPWTTKPGVITDMTFNDVVIQLSSTASTPIEESLPATVSEGVPYEHEYIFDISSNQLVQDKSQLRVVAVLINALDGVVANAEKAFLGDGSGVASPAAATRVTFTDLQGRQVATPRQGVYVKTSTFADGKRRSHTAVVK